MLNLLVQTLFMAPAATFPSEMFQLSDVFWVRNEWSEKRVELGYYSNGSPEGGCSLAKSSFRYAVKLHSFCVGRMRLKIGLVLRPCEVKSTK